VSARSIGNAFGIVITCNYDDCAERFQTANVRKSVNRAAAAKAGWRRGGAKDHKRWDVCPTHAPEEAALVQREADEREARKRERDAKQKAKLAPKPEVVRREAIRAAVLAAITRMDPLGGRTTAKEIAADVAASIPDFSYSREFRDIDRALQWHRRAGRIACLPAAVATDGRAGWRIG
jgi:hypothetical protein